jgi:hypothetical protein
MGCRALLGAIVAFVLAVRTATSAGLPKLPTGFGGLAIRPTRILISGDGSALLGGFTGRNTASRSNAHGGRLHWTKWLPGCAYATGAAWIDNGIPDEAHGTYHAYTAGVLAFRPRNGVFTRIRVVYIRPCTCGDGAFVEMLKATHHPAWAYGPAYWDWLG